MRDLKFVPKNVRLRTFVKPRVWVKLAPEDKKKYLKLLLFGKRCWVVHCPGKRAYLTRGKWAKGLALCASPNKVHESLRRNGRNGIEKLIMGKSDTWRTQLSFS